MNSKVLADESFERQYDEIIKPFCERIEKSDYFTSFDNNKIHYLSYINDNARANILVVHGFTECARKMDEMAYYFFNEGYNVYSLDLRGHGLSYKDTAPQYGIDIDDFDSYAKDVALFVKNVICRENDFPIYSFSHSLGCTAVLLALIDDDNLPIEKLVMSSPMICGNMGMPVGIAKAVATVITRLGKGKTPAPNKCVFDPIKINEDATSVQRGNHSIKQKVDNVEYQTCGPTFNWVLASIIACSKLIKNAGKINNKMLVIKPQQDAQLLASYQDKFFSQCENVEEITIPNTHHEIFQSQTPELEIYLNKIFEFLK